MENSIREQIRQINISLSKTLDLYDYWAKQNGLSYNTFAVYYTLDDLQSCTQTQICKSWALPKQTVHGILQDLEKKGYVCSRQNPQNKKERIISFTEQGKEFAAAVLSPLYVMEERAMRQLGHVLCTQLLECNNAYCEALEKEIKNG